MKFHRRVIKMLCFVAAGIGAASFLSGCGGSGSSPSSDDSLIGCADVYEPVCGLTSCSEQDTCGDYLYQNYSNACSAGVQNAQIVLHSECVDLEGKTTNASHAITVQPSSDDLPESPNSVSVLDARVQGHVAILELRYGGGCKDDHAFELHAAEPFLESQPVQILSRLVHRTNDTCEAQLRRTVEFDLRALRETYRRQYDSGSGEIQLKNLNLLYSF